MTRLQISLEAFALTYPQLWRDQVHSACAFFVINIALGLMLAVDQAGVLVSYVFLLEVVVIVYFMVRDHRLRSSGLFKRWPSMAVHVAMLYFVGLPLVLCLFWDPAFYDFKPGFYDDLSGEDLPDWYSSSDLKWAWVQNLVIVPLLAASFIQCADRFRAIPALANIFISLGLFVLYALLFGPPKSALDGPRIFEDPFWLGLVCLTAAGAAIAIYRRSRGRLLSSCIILSLCLLNAMAFGLIANAMASLASLTSSDDESFNDLSVMIFCGFFPTILSAYVIGELTRTLFQVFHLPERKTRGGWPLWHRKKSRSLISKVIANFANWSPSGWRESWHRLTLLAIINICFASALAIDGELMRPALLSDSEANKPFVWIITLALFESLIISYLWLRDLPIREVRRLSGRPSLFSMSTSFMIVYVPFFPILVYTFLANSSDNSISQFEAINASIFLSSGFILFMSGFNRSVILFGVTPSIFGLMSAAFCILCIVLIANTVFGVANNLFKMDEIESRIVASIVSLISLIALWYLLIINSKRGKISFFVSVMMLWVLVLFGWTIVICILVFLSFSEQKIPHSWNFLLLTVIAFIAIALAALIIDAMIAPISRQRYLPKFR